MEKKEQLNIEESLKKVWNQSEEMIKFCLKTVFYLKLHDCFISFDYKPTITKTIYYNDEYESPKIDEEFFINYNMEHNFKNNFRSFNFEEDIYLFPNYEQAPEIKYLQQLKGFELERLDKNSSNFRILTNEEKELVKKQLKIFEEDYLKRLKNYWKKYSKNVYASGYWANR